MLLRQRSEEMLGALWKINALDVENTLKAVCEAVLSDPGKPYCSKGGFGE